MELIDNSLKKFVVLGNWTYLKHVDSFGILEQSLPDHSHGLFGNPVLIAVFSSEVLDFLKKNNNFGPKNQ